MPKILNRSLQISGENQKVGTPNVNIATLDADGNVTRASGASTPTDADKGYAKGCIFTNTAGGVGTTVYINEGTAASADFNVVNGTGTAGAVTLDQLFLLDQALDILGNSSLTIDRSVSTATDVLTLTNSGGGSGNVLQITNVGTGKDISGTSATWSFTKAGAMVAKSMVIAGTAGSASITLTAGDMLLSDASLTITDADNAATLSITNDTATTASVFVFAGSGVFTGSTTTSFMTITPSGLTTGTGLYFPLAGLTTGKGYHSVGNALTSGILMHLATSATAIATTGRLFLSDHTGATGTSATLNEFKTAANDETILLALTAASLTTGTVLDFGTTAALTTGIGLKMAHTTSVIADTGSLVRLSSSSIDTGGSTNGTILDITASGSVAATLVKIRSTAASQTATTLLDINASGFTTGYTGSVVKVTSASTTGTGSLVLLTTSATTAGDALKIVANGLTLGAATGILVSHTTSVLGAGTSLVRISSTGVDTGTTTGVLLDLSTTSGAGQTNVLLTDSSADVNSRVGIFSKVTNAAAVLAIPFKSSSVAVVNSKFTRQMQMTDGTKTVTIWLDQDATDPNGVVTGTAGDICLNGPNNKIYICQGTTTWVTL